MSRQTPTMPLAERCSEALEAVIELLFLAAFFLLVFKLFWLAVEAYTMPLLGWILELEQPWRTLVALGGIAVPVGKDSLSMRTVWEEEGEERSVTAPLSLIVSAFAPVQDVRACWTPQLRTDRGETRLLLVDLGRGRNRLGGSALAQVFGGIGNEAPDLDDPSDLRALVSALEELRRQRLVLAYHDRSDGGLLVTLAEMAFAGGVGLEVALAASGGSDGPGAALSALFAEEPGVVLQVLESDVDAVRSVLAGEGLGDCTSVVGAPRDDDRFVVTRSSW